MTLSEYEKQDQRNKWRQEVDDGVRNTNNEYGIIGVVVVAVGTSKGHDEVNQKPNRSEPGNSDSGVEERENLSQGEGGELELNFQIARGI